MIISSDILGDVCTKAFAVWRIMGRNKGSGLRRVAIAYHGAETPEDDVNAD